MTTLADKMTWLGQGGILFGDYDPVNGTPEMGYLVNLVKIGCFNSSLTTNISRETGTIKESCSGQRLDGKKYTKGKSLAVKLTMTQFDRQMFANSVLGIATEQASGTVTDETLPTLADGDYFFLKHPHASSIVLTDSNATPATLVEGTNYKITDADQSVGEIIDGSSFTPPFKAAYSYDAYVDITGMAKNSIEKGLIYMGKNDEGAIQRLIIPRIDMAQDGDFNWIGDDPSPLTLSGDGVYAQELDDGSAYGGFMRISG